MKAIQFDQVGGPEVMHIAEVPKPEPMPGMVLVKNHAIGVNFTDVALRRGRYAFPPRLPETPGVESAGVIEAVGPGVSEFKSGMRVIVLGIKAYAEYCLGSAMTTIPIPEFMSFEHAAAFPVQVLTAWHMMHTSHHLSAGQTVLIHSAAGGVGIVAIQIAKSTGAGVIGTVSNDSKIPLAKQYGADEVINYETHDFAAEVQRLTGGRGVDLILDAVGKPTFEKGLKCLKPFGHLIVYGGSGGAPEMRDPMLLAERSLKVSGFALPTLLALPDVMRRGIESSLQSIREGKLRLLIGKTFPLAQAAEAHRWMESRQSVGKLLLIP